MITVRLLGQREKRAPDNSLNLDPWPLYHQMRTLDALRQSDVVMNTYNTGTGKTIASLLYLCELQGTGKNVLFIAPTNALLAQHAEDIEDFVARYRLDFKVLPASAADIRAIESGLRPGETLQRLIRNYLEFEPAAVRRQPIVLVVNPDIFYYALYFRYGAHDQRNVFERFLTAFDYLVIDEFHYYDSKQLANFLFALALFDQFGYFEARERKVCLLSATPTAAVRRYLDELFPGRWQLVAPENEPADTDALPSIPSLTPLDLRLIGGQLQEWVAEERETFRRWVEEGKDGAIISSGLWRVNQAHETLCTVLSESQMGRITGPEPPIKRTEATGRSLILATPTVDIGYNFKKLNKARQNVDFLVCDARFGDELLQRIGRAGRVLGKPEANQPSKAVALLSPEAIEALTGLDGQALGRAEFAGQIRDCGQLPPKHSLMGYIRSYAITECFYPIYQMKGVMPGELHNELEQLFVRIREVFAPGSRRTFGGLRAFFYKYHARQRWLSAKAKGAMPLDNNTANQLADWLAWLNPDDGRLDPAGLQPDLAYLLSDDAQRTALRAFVQSQVAVTEALFAFRDSFQGPRAVIYDPGHRLSSETLNSYDLFHLLSNYRLSPPLTRAEFQREFGRTELKGSFYFRLLDWRDLRLTLELAYDSQDDAAEFERKWGGAPVGLTGLRLLAREAGGDIVSGALPGEIAKTLADIPIVVLVIPPTDVGAMISRLRGTVVWSRRLTVYFPDGTVDDKYRIFIGKAAFEAHAELQGHFLMKDRVKSDAIIL